VTVFLTRLRVPDSASVRALVGHTIDDAGPLALAELAHRLAAAGSDWAYYAPDPLVRRLHRVLAAPVMRHVPVVTGIEHLRTVAAAPVVIFSNHLSYADANVIEALVARAGGAELADRLTVVAGPKVYSDLRRRFSSLAFGTVKTPQSSGLSSDEAVMGTRDVARAAKQSIEAATERLRMGEALLVFAEGTRSRDGAMQPFLSGVARYLRIPGTWVLPVGLTGTGQLYPVGEETLGDAPITMSIGVPMRAADLHAAAHGDRQLMMDRVGRAIARLLPPDYRGVYAAHEQHGESNESPS
jgi:1-acyl-sn-glycerol-3-phosphate acyltransferase